MTLPEQGGFKPTVPDVMPLVKSYRKKEGNSVGGNLHIVLDDGNIEDDHIEWCLNKCLQLGDDDGVALSRLLLKMSKTQRKKISDRFYEEDSHGTK